MRILLIDPPYERLIGFKSEWFPLGLTCLASFLKEKGNYKIGIYHGEHAADTEYRSIVKYSRNFHQYKKAYDTEHAVWKEIKKKIISFQPDVVGISVLTPKVPSAFRIAMICKELNQEIKVIFGGHHPTIRADDMLSYEFVDFVVRGEGEETLLALLKALQFGEINYKDIQGLSFRLNGKIIHNIDRKLIKDINSLPLPSLESIFGIETYTPVQLSMVMTSRGCPYNCGFCASQNVWGKNVRYRSIDNVLLEVEKLKSKYSIKNLTFMDDAFTINRERVIKFCQAMIESHKDVTWSCLTRVDVITDELIALMKRAGCTKIDIGIESGSQRILDMIGKKITLKRIRNAANILRRNKMFWSGFFMFGFPTETESEVLETLNFMKELKPNWVNMSIFTPYPGTALYRPSVERGLISDPPDYSLYSHQNPYSRSTDTLSEEHFSVLATNIFMEVHRFNSSYNSLIKRALTRKYHSNFALLFHDAKKVMTWLRR